jgi:hypothetical protein
VVSLGDFSGSQPVQAVDSRDAPALLRTRFSVTQIAREDDHTVCWNHDICRRGESVQRTS